MGKTIGFLLFQYRLVKTRRVLLWDYISLRWMISTITSKVYIMVVTAAPVIAYMKIFRDVRNCAQFRGR